MIGNLAIDALVDAKFIQKSQFKLASEIIAEEVLVRLSLEDKPQFSRKIIHKEYAIICSSLKVSIYNFYASYVLF